MTLFSEHNYSGAKEKLNVLRSNIPDPALRQQLDFACLLAEAYEAWDGLDFVSASQKMNHLTMSLRRDARAHHDFLLMDCRKELETQADILRSLSHIPEKIRDRHQQEILKDRELMANLMFSLYQNASIREQQDKYDMASLLMYRLLEMIEQRRLIQYGLYVSRMDYARLNFKKLESRGIPDLNALQTKMNTVRENVFGKAGNRLLPDQVSLLDGFMLLLALGDEICREGDGRDIDFIKRTRSMVYLRNNSIFAHGLGPVGKENYVKFRDFVIVVFKRYCRLEKIDFTKIASEVQFINPKDSDYYSGIGTGL
jgi:CRISPR-associated protein (TIGR02710 family)